MNQKSLLLAVFILLLLVQAAYASVPDPIAKAKKTVACILKLTNDISPFMGLSLILIGGLTYITAADDNQQRILGKKYAIMGIVGMVGVVALVSIAAQDPFNVPISLCGG
jgi:hypothetical protein